MTSPTFDRIAAITEHSAGFAEATRDNLDALVEHCPGWTVADLVWHLTEVHWFWATIAEERLQSPPEESRRPARAGDDGLVDAFVAGAGRLVRVLREADQSAPCWTWAPHQQDVAFITRHQVQEAAVHHWDAVNAAGGTTVLDPEVATDAVDEFLTFSVAPDPARPAGGFALRASDTGDTWDLADPDVPVLEATASDLLLWLYGRIDLDTSAVPGDAVARFRDRCATG
jgi:uncharacterized protein (TIGR03083 family)